MTKSAKKNRNIIDTAINSIQKLMFFKTINF